VDRLTQLAQATPAIVDPMLDTGSERSLGIWHDVLTLQVDHFQPAEIASLRRSPAWRSATTVLEAGSGNGRYLAGLRRAFPDKRYVGIDVSQGLADLAAERYADARLRFCVGDFLAGETIGTFDVVVMRFVVQHLADFAQVLARAAAHLNPGGSVIIIEPDLANSGNTPPTPAFAAMLDEFSRSAGARARLRVKLDTLADLIAETPGWELARQERLAVTCTGPFLGTNVDRLYRAWTGLCENQGTFAADFAAVRAELAQWSRLPGSESRVGLMMLEARSASGAGGQARRPAGRNRPLPTGAVS
jgi:SAM-dependent methyltransferase